MGDERAETYLRLVAEKEFRRVLGPPGGREGESGRPWSARSWAEVNMSGSDFAASALRNLRGTGRILIAAGALDEDLVDRLSGEVEAACTVRSRTQMARRGVLSGLFPPAGDSGAAGRAPPVPAAQPVRIVPLGQAFRLASERAPADLHFLSLAVTPTRATIAVMMRMHWPPDGSSADLEITGAGYHHLPYDRLWLTDDRGLRYQVTFDGEGGTASWRGVARLYPAPAPEVGWLDLIADGTERLIRLDLRPDARSRPRAGPGVRAPERWQVSPAERLLAVEAEAMLAAAWNRPGHTMDPHLGEIVATLAEAGLIATDSPVAGQLAALCQRLGVPAAGIAGPGIAGPGIAGRAAAELPARWASVLARRPADAAGPAGLAGTAGPEVFAPLATVLPDLEGTRFALAGLSVAAGESFLHVVASGMPALTGRFTSGWHPGFSWWVRAGNERGAGGWHVAVIADPADRLAGEAEFRLRLVPPLTLPLAGPLATIEVEVSGGSGRVRAVVPVRGGPGMADT